MTEAGPYSYIITRLRDDVKPYLQVAALLESPRRAIVSLADLDVPILDIIYGPSYPQLPVFIRDRQYFVMRGFGSIVSYDSFRDGVCSMLRP